MTPPVVDGVGGFNEDEIAEFQDKVRQAEASGPPQDEIIPGQMWSDKVGLPEGVNKAEADEAEVTIAREQSQPQTMSLRATATRCQTFWPMPHQVCGAILDRYEQLGANLSWLLLPVEPMSPNPDGQGQRQRFAGGFIYWHPDTGAHAVSPMTATVWQRNGWEAGWLGYPLGGEVPVEGSSTIDGEAYGWMQEFQGGQVYRTPALRGAKVASINGLILDRWEELGGVNSVLGFPIADEASTTDGQGRFSTFEEGVIYWHPSTGAHAVRGEILQQWAAAGYETSSYGYPVEDAVLEEGTTQGRQSFQNGVLSGNVSSAPDNYTISTPYIEFPNVEEAIEYFDEIQNRLDDASSMAEARSITTQQLKGREYGPCTLFPSVVHERSAKSGKVLSVGFKPYTRCSVPVDSIDHQSRLMYKWWSVWREATPGPPSSNRGQKNLTTTNIQFFCNGEVNTRFKGSTIGTISFGGKSYYSRVFTPTAEENCRV